MAVQARKAGGYRPGSFSSPRKKFRGGTSKSSPITYHSYNSHVSIQKKDHKPGKSNGGYKPSNNRNFRKTAQASSRFTRHKNQKPHHKRSHGDSNYKTLVVFHGTANPSNASDILKNGWCISCKNGNAYGDGIYFTPDLSIAKSYAGNGGVYLKCKLRLKRVCKWDSQAQQQYNNWCVKNNVAQDNSAITAWALKHGYDALESGSVIVLLFPLYANPTAYKWNGNGKIKIISVHDPATDQKKWV